MAAVLKSIKASGTLRKSTNELLSASKRRGFFFNEVVTYALVVVAACATLS